MNFVLDKVFLCGSIRIMSGKGMKPKGGYDNKKYSENYDSIFRKKEPKKK